MDNPKRHENKSVIVSTRLTQSQFIALRHIADEECTRPSVSAALRKLVRECLTRRAVAPKGTHK